MRRMVPLLSGDRPCLAFRCAEALPKAHERAQDHPTFAHGTTRRVVIVSFSPIVLYEWLRGPRTDAERDAVDAFFEVDLMAVFGRHEAARAADLYGRVKGARQRQADLAIAACAIELGASLWTLTRSDFEDIPGLALVPE